MSRTVRCRVEWYEGGRQDVSFAPLLDYRVTLRDGGPVGPHGIGAVSADLLELGGAIFWIERQLLRRRDPPVRFSLSFPVRDLGAWSNGAIDALANTLSFLGGADWSVEAVPRTAHKDIPAYEPTEGTATDVVLFSGGLDSTCGIASLSPGTTRLVSYYSRQRTQQRRIAAILGHSPPMQARLDRSRARMPGRTFHYRSFFFLCLGAAVALSWHVRRITQFENGVMASAVPPSPAWLMTKHAHPRFHVLAGRFFSELLGGEWTITNPFLPLTKRECVAAARQERGAVVDKVTALTDSCWHIWSNRIPGASATVPGAKRPGKPCGVCIPCLVRRTALTDTNYARDLSSPRWQNHERFGRDFRAYYGFLDRVSRIEADRSMYDFYRVLPAPGRELFTGDLMETQDLFRLFRTFADEFMATFGR